MARTIKEYRLNSREARGKLKVQGYCYWREVERGVHVGYRRLKGRAGTWWARFYQGDRSYAVEPLGIADDQSDADGVKVLSWSQVVKGARKRMVERAYHAEGKHVGPYTVAQAMTDYLDWLENEGRSSAAIADARYRYRAFIGPKLGGLEVASLTADNLRRWRDALAKSLPRVRTKAGDKQKYREITDDDEARRTRRASTNRTWTTLRAALNRAFETDKVDSDKAWRKVKPFKSVDKARVRYLEVADAQRHANATDGEFRPMVKAALLTGGRYGQLARLLVADFNRDASTVRMTTRKGDGTEKVYYVHLTEEGGRFFKQACVGHNDAKGLIFRKADGSAWQKSDQARRMKDASERAKIRPPVNFNCLRHTYASHAVMNGTPLLVIAKNLGHSDTRMVEKHYGHLAPSYIADAIRAGAPRFGFRPDTKVAVLRRDR